MIEFDLKKKNPLSCAASTEVALPEIASPLAPASRVIGRIERAVKDHQVEESNLMFDEALQNSLIWRVLAKYGGGFVGGNRVVLSPHAISELQSEATSIFAPACRDEDIQVEDALFVGHLSENGQTITIYCEVPRPDFDAIKEEIQEALVSPGVSMTITDGSAYDPLSMIEDFGFAARKFGGDRVEVRKIRSMEEAIELFGKPYFMETETSKSTV